MTLDAWLTLGVVLAAVTTLAWERAPAPFVVLAATTALLALGVVDTEQAFGGFSNPAPITVGALYVIAAAVDRSGALDGMPWLLGSERSSEPTRLARLLVPTALASSVLNNTPIVAMLAPTALAWARRTGRAPSRYLIPISFAAILGGLLTLVGTSTNLVVSGLLDDAGHTPLGLFEIGRVGLPVAGAGLVYLILVAPRLLPDRRAPGHDLTEDAREFMVEMVIEPTSPLVGETPSTGGLRNLEGVFLVELERGGRRLTAVSPDEPLQADDRLSFAGNVERILDLQRIPGLVSAEEHHFPDGDVLLRRRFFEAVVAEGSVLANSTLKRAGFRSRYGAAVVAIHRANERMGTKLGEVLLRPGDLLLVLGDHAFPRRTRELGDFLVVAPLGGEPPRRREKQGTVAAVVGAMLLIVGSGLLDIVPAALLAAIAMVALGVLTPTQARRAIDMNVLIVIAGSFGLGAAIRASGLDRHIVDVLIGPLGAWGDSALLLGVLVATVIITELVTNNAAAILMFPVAITAAESAGLDPRGFAIAVALGASASFLSPIGYQTNTMVYAMGGYRFTDFARAGLPLTLIMMTVAALVIPVAWPLR